jgi:glycosyltransferase involved in cell wall biosynthesis
MLLNSLRRMVMENKKVLLKFPLNISDSTYYKSLIQYPPKGHKYITEIETGIIDNKFKRCLLKKSKSFIRTIFNKLNISRPLYSSNNVDGANIVHYAHCLPVDTTKNYVVDIEGVWQLAIGHIDKSRETILNILSDDKCKAILPWTYFAYQEFVKVFPELKHKTHVLRPAVPLMLKSDNFVESKKFTMLYVARDFELKNGELACKIINNIITKYGPDKVKGIVIANVPSDIKTLYPMIEYKNLMSGEELKEYYSKSDVLIYPSPVDTFGFAIIEAMSYGIPSIVMKTEYTPSIREIIVDGYNGFVFNSSDYEKGVSEIIDKFLVSNDPENLKKIKDYYDVRVPDNPEKTEFYNKVSYCCKTTMLYGPYSIDERNRRLYEVLSKC